MYDNDIVPGRNDLCWCGSGTVSYTHLESVAAGSGSEVLGSLKRRCAAHKLTFFRSGGQDYLGTLAHACDYYVYIYTPASSFARGAVLAGAATLAFYVAAVAGMASSRWRVEHRFLEQAIE